MNRKTEISGTNIIAAQPGPQTMFLASPADIVIYGGAAGGGKTYALLLEAARHIYNPKFRCLILRRTTKNVTNPGGIWDMTFDIYPLIGGFARESKLEWEFPSGATIKFSHIEYESNKYDYQGAQIDLICFDELTEFSKSMFIFMLMRNRSVSGVRPYIRATCNPDPDSFVFELVKWYLNENLEYPFSGRSGKIRYFINLNDTMHWADTRQELIDKFGTDVIPKSFTYIPSSIEDNQILMRINPEYLANLNALYYVDRMRYLHGNWKIRHSAGNVFQERWWNITDAPPASSQIIEAVRCWDFAATVETEKNPNPDFTACCKMLKLSDGTFLITDSKAFRETPLTVEKSMQSIASQDGPETKIRFWRDPGQAGKYQEVHLLKLLAGYDIAGIPAINDKLTNAKPYAAQVEAGNVKLLRGDWNQRFVQTHANFQPDMKNGHDDEVDAGSGAFKTLTLQAGCYVG